MKLLQPKRCRNVKIAPVRAKLRVGHCKVQHCKVQHCRIQHCK